MERVDIGDWCTLHRGDCLDILPTLEGPFDALITDPPYSSGGAFRGDRMIGTADKYFSTGAISEVARESFSGDNRDQRSWGYWCTLWLLQARGLIRPGGLAMVFTDWRQLPQLTDSLQAAGWVWRGIAVWDKTEAARPQRGRFRAQSEFIVWASNGPCGTDGPAAPGVFRQSVGRDRLHPTEKPSDVLHGLLQIAGSRVLDPFMGSGSLAPCCFSTKRAFTGIELDRRWFDAAVKRINRQTTDGALFAPPEPDA